MKKKVLSLVLLLALIMSIVSLSAMAEDAAKTEPEAAAEQGSENRIAQPVGEDGLLECGHYADDDSVEHVRLQCGDHWACNPYHLNSTSPVEAHDNCEHCGQPKCDGAHSTCGCGGRQCDGGIHGVGWCYNQGTLPPVVEAAKPVPAPELPVESEEPAPPAPSEPLPSPSST